MSEVARELERAARALARGAGRLRFREPVFCVYNPLEYAWAPHREYIQRFGATRKRVLFLGMNPGPFGMAQTGVPFGEIAAVREWMGIEARVRRPRSEHPARPVQGFGCPRHEVSGARLWGAIAEHCGTPARFFRQAYVANYCPLLFLEESGRNRTPDALPREERERLNEICDAHLVRIALALQPEWVIGVGAYARTRAGVALDGMPLRIGGVLHPSPASPAANRGWAEAAHKQLCEQGVCPDAPQG